MNRISELYDGRVIDRGQDSFLAGSPECPFILKGIPVRDRDEAVRVNIIAMGDVGGTVLLGLRLLAGELISTIGIYDLNSSVTERYEREINQVTFPDGRALPKVRIIDASECFDCDVFVFCATKAVPPLEADGDVRMVQLEANKGLVEMYARQAVDRDFKGLFAVVSDPVDPLCMAAANAGLNPSQIKGYGLGVMYARALYAAGELGIADSFRAGGRAFGPHGVDLVIADNINDYSESVSLELTRRAVESNLVTRQSGFKPYIAPAMSSAAISLIETIRGGWNYSSVFNGQVFLGCRNRIIAGLTEVEDYPLDRRLFERIRTACSNLAEVLSYER